MSFFTHTKQFASIALVALSVTVAVAATAHADCTWLTAGNGYRVDDCLIGQPFETFCMVDTHTAMIITAGFDMKMVDLDSGSVLQNFGQPSDGYYTDPLNINPETGELCLWTSFITKSPIDGSYWVGFTNDGNDNDHIYQVTPSGTWTYRATLKCNYDLDFMGEYVLVSANYGGETAGNNQLVLMDTSGSDNHTILVNVGGYSAGLGAGTQGNVYYATYPGSSNGNSLLHFSFTEAEIQTVLNGGEPYDLSDADVLYNTTLGAADTEVDTAGHVIFNGNSFTGSGYISLWNEQQPNTVTTLASSSPGYWLGNLETEGDLLDEPGSSVCVAAWGAPGIAKITKLIPGDANSDGTVDGSDATILAGYWQRSDMGWAEGDFNGDHVVDGSDATILAGYWQQTLPGSAQSLPTNAVPEPGMMTLLVVLASLVSVVSFVSRVGSSPRLGRRKTSGDALFEI